MASRRVHLLYILKCHHTYSVNTFVCSYSLNPNPSHSLLLSSLLDWQPYTALRVSGFPGLYSVDAFALRANASNLEQYFTQMRPRVPCYHLDPIEDKANLSRFGNSLSSHFLPLPPPLLPFLLLFFFFFFFFFFFAYNPS